MQSTMCFQTKGGVRNPTLVKFEKAATLHGTTNYAVILSQWDDYNFG